MRTSFVDLDETEPENVLTETNNSPCEILGGLPRQ